MGNGPKKLTYRVSQLLIGHGSFAVYLRKIGTIKDDMCIECSTLKDDASHMIFECTAFKQQRRKLCSVLGGQLTHESIIGNGSGENILIDGIQ